MRVRRASALQVARGLHNLWPPRKKVLEVNMFLLSGIATTMALFVAGPEQGRTLCPRGQGIR